MPVGTRGRRAAYEPANKVILVILSKNSRASNPNEPARRRYCLGFGEARANRPRPPVDFENIKSRGKIEKIFAPAPEVDRG